MTARVEIAAVSSKPGRPTPPPTARAGRASAPAERAGNALVAIGTASTANGTMNTAQAKP